MDDFVYWSDDKAALLRVRDAVGAFLEGALGLWLKDTPYVNRTAHGMDFLGFRIRPDGLRAAREGLKRYKRKTRMCGMLFREGILSEEAYQNRNNNNGFRVLCSATSRFDGHFATPAV